MIVELQEKGHKTWTRKAMVDVKTSGQVFRAEGVSDQIFSANMWQGFGIFHEGNFTGNSYTCVEASPSPCKNS